MKSSFEDTSGDSPAEVCAVWFERALGGDEEAATRLYQHCIPRLNHWLGQRLSHPQPCELAHDALTLAFRKHALFRRGTHFMPWLKTLAWRMALNQIRDRTREQTRIDDWIELQRLESSPPTQMGDPRLVAVSRCLVRLPEPQRQLLQWHYVEGRSSQAIAQEQGRSRVAVAVSLHRICQKMRHHLSSSPA